MKKIKILLIIFIMIIVSIKQIDITIKEKNIEIKQEKILEKILNYDTIPNDYLGYIEIEKYNIKRLIKDNTLKSTLDLGYVGMFYKSSSLDSNSNIILAGHNKKDIFSCLHKISINDSIKIITNKVSYNFKVIKKVIIDDTDYSYFNNKNEKILTLITCTNNNRKRLLVISKYSN